VSLTSGLLLVVFLLVVIGSSLGARMSPALPHSTLLRSLFPSWRFFETRAPSLCLLARVVRGESEVRPFAPLLPDPARGLHSLFFSPRGNLLLAYQGLLERLLSELGATEQAERAQQAEQLVSYRLVQNLARSFLAREPGSADLHYQLKLVARGPGQAENEELLVSPLYPLA
jgi:hypothetical protein